jgi:hypothetical protein
MDKFGIESFVSIREILSQELDLPRSLHMMPLSKVSVMLRMQSNIFSGH